MLKKLGKILPGVVVAVVIAFISQFIEGLLPIHLIGASVIALFIGMTLNALLDTTVLKEGFKFTSKKLLKFAIILLGASLNIQTVLNVGSMSIAVMTFTLLTCFGGGYFIGKALGLDWKLSNLISAGTGICGGSAIAAIAPVVDAEDRDIAYAMSATFIFDMIMIVAFPFMGHFLGLSDMAYGLWAGTAVNDTSSVVAAGYAYTEAAGDFATMVKLTRTLTIIPVVIVFAYINIRVKRGERVKYDEAFYELNQKATKYEVSQTDKIRDLNEKVDILNDEIETITHKEKAISKVNFINLFPWFIVGFVGLAIINSFGVIPTEISSIAKDFSKFLMVSALAAIGFSTSFKDMKKSGPAPMIHGFIISALVVIVAIAVEWCMGIV